MNILPRSIGLIFSLLTVCATAQADTTVFVNVNVLPMTTEGVVAEQSVVVVDGQIARIGHVDTVPVPKGAMVVDGTDRYLMPGLAEMHAHLTSTAPEQFDRLATLFVANGVTTVRGMLGRESHLALRDQLSDGELFGPRLVTSGPSLNGQSVAGPADAARQVRAQKAAGYDFIKVHPGLSREEFVALAETANEIGIPYAGHVPVAAGIQEALRLRIRTIDHLDGYFAAMLPPDSDGSGGFGGFFDVMLADELDAGKIPALAEATASTGVWNVPTQVLIEQNIDRTSLADLKSRSENRYVSSATLNGWLDAKRSRISDRNFDRQTAARAVELRRQLILELHKAGAGLLLGSDAPQTFNVAGFSLHRELKTLVSAGLTPYEALRTGTVAVAKFLASNGGEVAEGKDADLILLDANPLQNIENSQRIHGVMLRGVWLPGGELESRLLRFAVGDGT